jgi:hypothetical protein
VSPENADTVVSFQSARHGKLWLKGFFNKSRVCKQCSAREYTEERRIFELQVQHWTKRNAKSCVFVVRGMVYSKFEREQSQLTAFRRHETSHSVH